MVYVNDPKRRRSYITRIIIHCVLFFLLVILMEVLLTLNNKELIMYFGITDAVIFIFYLLLILRSGKNYDSVLIELNDVEINIKSSRMNKVVNLCDVTKICRYPTLFDSKQIIIFSGKWKAIAINSYLENYNDFIDKLNSVKIIENKSGIARKIFNIIIYAVIFFGLLAYNLNKPLLTIVAAVLGIIGAVINVIRYAKSDISGKRKGVYLIVYVLVIFVLLMMSVTTWWYYYL